MAQNIFDKSTVATTIKAKKAEEARLKMQYKRASKMNKGFFDTAQTTLTAISSHHPFASLAGFSRWFLTGLSPAFHSPLSHNTPVSLD